MSTGIAVIVAFALFLGGMYLFALAFTLSAWQGPVFVGGILAISLALAIPAHLLPGSE